MAKRVQIRRGTNALVAAYTGPAAEIIANIDTFTLHVQDGVTPGGHSLARSAQLDTVSARVAVLESTSGTTIITGGSVDGVPIGSVSPSTAVFTSLTNQGSTTLGDSLADATTVSGSMFVGGNAVVYGSTTLGDNASDSLTITGTVINTPNGLTFNSTSAIGIPVGTTAQRPLPPLIGHLRFNTTLGQSEIYDGSAWTLVGSGGGSSVTITNDVSTNATVYPAFVTATSGTATVINVANTKMSFNPSTGQLNAVAFNATSDRRAKTNIRDIGYGLSEVLQLNGCKFEMVDGGNTSVGLIAQDVQAIIPEVVSGNADGLLGINYPVMVAVLVEAMKELKTEIDTLRSQLNA